MKILLLDNFDYFWFALIIYFVIFFKMVILGFYCVCSIYITFVGMCRLCMEVNATVSTDMDKNQASCFQIQQLVCPSISHIFFADNSLIFCRANTIEWVAVQSILDLYEKASGQGINKQKIKIFFSATTNRNLRNHLLDLAGVSLCNGHEKYQGLPIMVGKNKYETFEAIKNKVWAKISNWKNVYLSQAGKGVLLKSVVQALPTYVMSLLLLSRKL